MTDAAAENSWSVCGRRYDTGEPVRITIAGERIVRVEPAWPLGRADAWPFVAPGLFDLQINGHGGVWFCQTGLTPVQVATAVHPYYAAGVTRLLPTLITNSFEGLADGFAAIAEACRTHEWLEKTVVGCHLEGPYLSGEDGPRGAHPKPHIRPADWQEFSKLQELSGNRIRLVTIAPEVEGAVSFTQKAVASGVTVAIGHTAATGEQIRAVVKAGATLSTHLGNGSHVMLRRHPNYIWEQLGEPELSASLITDGHHIPPSVVRSIVRAKGTAKTIVTCDAAGWAGCAPGRYKNELGEVEVLASGKIVVAGQDAILAGAGQLTDVCVNRLIEYTGVTLREAIDMTCRNVSKLLRLEETAIRKGSRADLVLFRPRSPTEPFGVEATVVAGRTMFGTIPEPSVMR